MRKLFFSLSIGAAALVAVLGMHMHTVRAAALAQAAPDAPRAQPASADDRLTAEGMPMGASSDAQTGGGIYNANPVPPIPPDWRDTKPAVSGRATPTSCGSRNGSPRPCAAGQGRCCAGIVYAAKAWRSIIWAQAACIGTCPFPRASMRARRSATP